METLIHQTTLVVVECWCGMPHAVPETLRNKQQNDHRDGRKQTEIYCPLGHSYIIAGDGEADRLKRRLEAAQNNAARLAALHDQAEAEARAQKGRATRFKNERDKLKTRTAAGVCPECNRTFKQLARHMQTKHPHACR